MAERGGRGLWFNDRLTTRRLVASYTPSALCVYVRNQQWSEDTHLATTRMLFSRTAESNRSKDPECGLASYSATFPRVRGNESRINGRGIASRLTMLHVFGNNCFCGRCSKRTLCLDYIAQKCIFNHFEIEMKRIENNGRLIFDKKLRFLNFFHWLNNLSSNDYMKMHF